MIKMALDVFFVFNSAEFFLYKKYLSDLMPNTNPNPTHFAEKGTFWKIFWGYFLKLLETDFKKTNRK